MKFLNQFRKMVYINCAFPCFCLKCIYMKELGRITAITIVFLISLAAAARLVMYSVGFANTDYESMNDVIDTTIYYHDNRVKRADGVNAAGINAGDTIQYIVSLPEDRYIEDSSLCFRAYHSDVKVYEGDQLIFTYGQEYTEEGKMHGNEFIHCPIPKDAWGGNLKVVVKQVEGSGSDHYTEFRVLPNVNVRWYPLIGRGFEFLLFLMLVCAAFAAFLLFIILRFFTRSFSRKGLALSAFVFLISAWYLGSRDMLYVLLDNTYFSAVFEHFAVMLAPVPMYHFFAESANDDKLRKDYRFIAAVFSVFFLVTTSLALFTKWKFEYFEVALYVLFISSVVITFIIEIRHRHRRFSLGSKILLCGSLLTLMVAFIQMILTILRRRFPDNIALMLMTRFDVSTIGLLLFIITLGVSLLVTFTSSIRREVREDQLRELAYVDMLTGIHNRNYCAGQMEERDRKKIFSYGIVFFDADKLKYANDHYGHETGDDIIRSAANCIKAAFADCQGFFGRWGGDEFIAVFDHPDDIPHFEERFRKEMDKINESGRFAFRFTVSYGAAVNNGTETSAVVRDRADSEMYIYKQKHGVQRG